MNPHLTAHLRTVLDLVGIYMVQTCIVMLFGGELTSAGFATSVAIWALLTAHKVNLGVRP